jgi:hypothetical protein
MQQIIAKNTKIFFTSWHLGFNSAFITQSPAQFVLYLPISRPRKIGLMISADLASAKQS